MGGSRTREACVNNDQLPNCVTNLLLHLLYTLTIINVLLQSFIRAMHAFKDPSDGPRDNVYIFYHFTKFI